MDQNKKKNTNKKVEFLLVLPVLNELSNSLCIGQLCVT